MTTVVYQGIIKDINLPNDVLIIITKLCDNSVNLDLDRADILQQLLLQYESKKIPIAIVVSNYLSIARDISESHFPQPVLTAFKHIMKSKPTSTIEIVNDFIKDLRQHAALVKHMQAKFNLFLSKPELQIEVLAVLAYLLDKRIYALTKIGIAPPVMKI